MQAENKEYLPIEGLASFNTATINLLLGFNNAASKVMVVKREGGGGVFQ